VLERPVELLEDHAHLERKAATNAFDLMLRWPHAAVLSEAPEGERAYAIAWAESMSRIARDETEHLATVLRELSLHGGSLGRVHRNPYAASLRALVRSGGGTSELVDRLLVSALIEARSCERFGVLAATCEDARLARLYGRLEESERGHHRVFLDLALGLPGARAVRERWERLLESEAAILREQPPGPRLHSGDGS
jgi:tRNA-(ms[2]io[6]A)-hydroxylase